MKNELFSGISDLADEIESMIKKAENPLDILEEGAKECVNDLKKSPKPISKIRKSGYTHLIKTFSYRKKGKEIEVGWGKYYGPMIEHGTSKMGARAHLYPCYNQNKNKYNKIMLDKFYN